MFRAGENHTLGPPSLPLWQRMALLCLGYFFCAWLGHFISEGGGTAVNFWLPGGLFMAVLLVNPTRDWPWLMLAIVPANAMFDLLHDPEPNFYVITFFCAANIIQSGIGAGLVRRFVAAQPTLATLKEFFGLLVLAGMAGSAVGATLGATMLTSFHLAESFVPTWKILWGGNVMAVLVLAPFILKWFASRDELRPRSLSPWRAVEVGMLFGGMLIFLWYVFVPGFGADAPKFLVLVFMLWAGLRFQVRGAAAAVFILAVTSAFLTSHILKGHPAAEISSGSYAFTLQVFVAVAAMVAMVPAIVLAERNRALAGLRESEERFRNLTAAAFEGVAISEAGRLLDVNDQMLKIFGRKRNEVIGHEIIEFVATESRVKVSEAVLTGDESTYEHQLIRKDGTHIYVEARARMVQNGGRTLRMTAIRDVNEQKLAEQALRESEERFSKAFHASPDAMSISDLKTGCFIDINDGYPRLYGYTREEMIGHTSVELKLWRDLADRDEMVRRLRADGAIRNYAGMGRKRSGELFHNQFSAETVEIKGRACIISVVRDMTTQKKAELALRASEESLRATIENTPYVAVQWYDLQGRVTFWNRASENIYGWTAAEALGKTLDELMFTKEQGAAFLQAIGDMEQQGKPSGPAEYQFRRRDGKSGIVLSTLFKIQTPSGEPCFVCMDVDLTRRKQAEALTNAQMQVLEMIAQGQPLKETLETLLLMVEAQSPEMLCSILLLEPDGQHVRHGAGPSLPLEFLRAVDGSAIGPRAGSCGTAIFRREPVLVADISTDPLWADYKELALPHGLRACWSTPIFDNKKNVLGTFAIYYRTPGLPDEQHRKLIEMATHTAAVCIGKYRSEAERVQAVAREQQARITYTFQLIASQEAERKRIAAELHDSIGQNLLLIKNLAQMASRNQDPAQTYEQVATINHLATQCIAEARQISRDLHPHQLEHLGLKRSLELMLEKSAQASTIKFSWKLEDIDDVFSAEAAMNLYRIVQESLNNILKHSRANEVRVKLERDVHEVVLQITDDGCGFVPATQASSKSGMGLKNITERAGMLGGKLQIDSTPETGTRIVVAVPVATEIQS